MTPREALIALLALRYGHLDGKLHRDTADEILAVLERAKVQA